MKPVPYTLSRVHADAAFSCVDALTEVLLDCVAGGASVGFMQDLDATAARQFWLKVAESVQRKERILMVARDAAGRVVGTVQGVVDLPPNQPHRADVAKMLVHRCARRQGLAQALLDALCAELQAAGKTLAVLDTVTGGDAERLYTRTGWQPVGVIPGFALFPDGSPCGTTLFYKRL